MGQDPTCVATLEKDQPSLELAMGAWQVPQDYHTLESRLPLLTAASSHLHCDCVHGPTLACPGCQVPGLMGQEGVLALSGHPVRPSYIWAVGTCLSRKETTSVDSQ